MANLCKTHKKSKKTLCQHIIRKWAFKEGFFSGLAKHDPKALLENIQKREMKYKRKELSEK